jgi:hypothetical protein
MPKRDPSEDGLGLPHMTPLLSPHPTLQALGAQHDYELVKKGNEYHCVHAGHTLRVRDAEQ